jgi:hypothetical protein
LNDFSLTADAYYHGVPSCPAGNGDVAMEEGKNGDDDDEKARADDADPGMFNQQFDNVHHALSLLSLIHSPLLPNTNSC